MEQINKKHGTNSNHSHTQGLKGQCKKWECLPKLSLIRGERMALQLTGGYWKLVPTVASGAKTTFIRSGVMASGPAAKENIRMCKTGAPTTDRESNLGKVYV